MTETPIKSGKTPSKTKAKPAKKAVAGPPKTDSVLELLLYGLHNEDQATVDSVLEKDGDEVIKKTVASVPPADVASLLKEIKRRIKVRYLCQE